MASLNIINAAVCKGVCDLQELVLANNNIDIPAGGLGGSEGPGLAAVPLLEGANATLRCLILERNGLRFQQNPACQRRHWRELLAEQLPHLEAIDGESLLLEEIPKVHANGAAEGALRESDHALSLQNMTGEDIATTAPVLNLSLQQHDLFPQFQRLTPHSTKPFRPRLLLPAKHEELPCSGPSLLRQAATSPDLRSLNFGVVGVGAPGASIEGSLENAQPRHESLLINSGKWRKT
ncbi:hypothetical protein Emed_003658 [Eimeria media]